METKTFFAYTPQDFKMVYTMDTRKPHQANTVKIPYGERATIAVKITGDKIVYGIAVCDHEDKFDKSKGRFIAQERMLQGFGTVAISNFKFKNKVTPDQIAIYFLNSLTNSVYNNFGKYKHKINEFRKRGKKKSAEVTLTEAI